MGSLRNSSMAVNLLQAFLSTATTASLTMQRLLLSEKTHTSKRCGLMDDLFFQWQDRLGCSVDYATTHREQIHEQARTSKVVWRL